MIFCKDSSASSFVRCQSRYTLVRPIWFLTVVHHGHLTVTSPSFKVRWNDQMKRQPPSSPSFSSAVSGQCRLQCLLIRVQVMPCRLEAVPSRISYLSFKSFKASPQPVSLHQWRSYQSCAASPTHLV